jgi:hypothetical protein
MPLQFPFVVPFWCARLFAVYLLFVRSVFSYKSARECPAHSSQPRAYAYSHFFAAFRGRIEGAFCSLCGCVLVERVRAL